MLGINISLSRFHYRSLENNWFDAPDESSIMIKKKLVIVQVKLHLCTLSYIFSVSGLRLGREFNSRLELRTFSVLQIFVAAFCVQPDHFDSEKIRQTNKPKTTTTATDNSRTRIKYGLVSN